MNTFGRQFPRLAAAGLALALCVGQAQAQYVWIDAKGVRQYSDRPPPPSTPGAKILKAPARAPEPLSLPAAAEGAPAAAPKGPMSLAERDADFRKRAAERAEQEKKQAEQARMQASLAARCGAAREAHAQLVSGIRIAKVGADGERAFITDEERAQRMARVREELADCR